MDDRSGIDLKTCRRINEPSPSKKLRDEGPELRARSGWTDAVSERRDCEWDVPSGLVWT
jgi:hypothetical protein